MRTPCKPALSSLAKKGKFASTGEAENMFKRVKLTGRDATHEWTRVLKRPFLAHPELESMLSKFVSGNDSFAQKIQHSLPAKSAGRRPDRSKTFPQPFGRQTQICELPQPSNKTLQAHACNNPGLP